MVDGTNKQTGGGSLSDLLTAAQNLVKAVTSLAQNYLNVQGLTIASNIAAATVVKPATGRVVRVSITVTGSATGLIYDSASVNTTTRPIWVIPEAPQTSGEPYEVQLPVAYGILVVPGTGQTLSVSYS
jgi:hypothetical protein